MSRFSRRQFLKIAGGALGGLALSSFDPMRLLAGADRMHYRPLGKTGVEVSLLGMGGFHLGINDFTDDTATDFVHYAMDHGVTFFDNAREYNEGRSEKRMGKALQGKYREKAFLMTKNCAHDGSYKSSMKSLEDSLQALQTDHIDLWIFHEVNYANDPEMIFTRGGIEAAIEARKQGKVRFIGFSGHKSPAFHLDMLSRPFEWDAVMIPLGIMDSHRLSFTKQVLPVLERRNIGVIGFKSLGGFLSGVPQKIGVPVRECLRYSMSHQASTIVVGMENQKQLEENLETAYSYTPMFTRERQALIEKTRPFAADLRMEIYKNTPDFDSPIGKGLHGIR